MTSLSTTSLSRNFYFRKLKLLIIFNKDSCFKNKLNLFLKLKMFYGRGCKNGKNEKMVTTVHDSSQLMRSCFLLLKIFIPNPIGWKTTYGEVLKEASWGIKPIKLVLFLYCSIFHNKKNKNKFNALIFNRENRRLFFYRYL